MGEWKAAPWTKEEAEKFESAAGYFDEYCSWCDFNEGTLDDCYCEENCGEIGCQGLISSKKD